MAGIKPQPHLILDVPSSVHQEMLSLAVVSPWAYWKPAVTTHLCTYCFASASASLGRSFLALACCQSVGKKKKMVKLYDNNKVKLQLLLLAKEIREENTDIDNFFPLILASPLQPPTPSSSLNRKFLCSKKGRVKHQLRGCTEFADASLHISASQLSQLRRILCMSLKTSMGLTQCT